MRNGIRRALAFWPLCAWAGCASQPGLTASDAGFVHWIGLDSRPLAVGSKLIVTLEIATDGGAAPSYTVASSNPRVATVEDAGTARLLLSVLREGTTTLELQTADEKASLPVTAFTPVALEMWDAEHLAAGIDGGQLAPIFGVLMTSEEVLQGVVLDASGRALNSWGLVQGTESTPALLVSMREPEHFILAQGFNTNTNPTFTADLIDAGVPVDDGGTPPEDEDGGLPLNAERSVSYQINFVPLANGVRLLRGGPSELNVLAQALFVNAGNTTEVFGVEDWEFSCFPPDSCTMNRLSTSVVSLTIRPGTGSHDVFASSSSQTLEGMLVIP